MAIIPVIINQHAEEASFLWLLRNSAAGEPHYRLADLAHLDERVEAHLDGLRIAGDEGWEICREAMALQEPGEIFTAGVLAFESRIPERMDAVLAAVESDGTLQRALISALGWIDFERVADAVRLLVGADLAFLRYIGLAAQAVHRRDPGRSLSDLIDDADAGVRARALKAAGEMGRRDLLPAVYAHTREDDSRCCFYAAWAATLLGDPSAVELMKRLAVQVSEFAADACDLAVRRGAVAESHQWLDSLARQAGTLGLAVRGYGALGDPAAVPWLLEKMQVDDLARAAGASFSMITGVDIAYEDLDGERPEGFEAGPSERPEEDNVTPDPDDDLPWPDSSRIARWWSAHEKRLQKGRRHLCGQPLTREHCRQILTIGYQRQRKAAALEMTLMDSGRPLFEVRAPGYRQQTLLGGPGDAMADGGMQRIP